MKKLFIIPAVFILSFLICAGAYAGSINEYLEARSCADSYQQEMAVARFNNLVENYPLSFFAPRSLFGIAEYAFLKKDTFDTSNQFMQVVDNYPRSGEALYSYVYLAAIYKKEGMKEAQEGIDNLLRNTYFAKPFIKTYSFSTYRKKFSLTSVFNHKYKCHHGANDVTFYRDYRPIYTLILSPAEKK